MCSLRTARQSAGPSSRVSRSETHEIQGLGAHDTDAVAARTGLRPGWGRYVRTGKKPCEEQMSGHVPFARASVRGLRRLAYAAFPRLRRGACGRRWLRRPAISRPAGRRRPDEPVKMRPPRRRPAAARRSVARHDMSKTPGSHGVPVSRPGGRAATDPMCTTPRMAGKIGWTPIPL